jgi:hypothetical protein
MLFMLRVTALVICMTVIAGAARSETTNCTEVPSVPFFINTPGIYCLKMSLSLASAASTGIEIQADDVVLDLNGFVLDGSAAGAGTSSWGIRAANHKNVTIRNGTVRGFYVGIFAGWITSEWTGNVLEDLLVDRSTGYAMIVYGPGIVVRKNRVTKTGGSTFTASATAIYAGGAGAHVIDNEVVDTLEAAGGLARGISLDSAPGAVVERNVISNAALGPNSSYGVYVLNNSTRSAVVGNRIANMRNGISFLGGGTGLYMDNTVGGATTAFSGGTAAGATNFSF